MSTPNNFSLTKFGCTITLYRLNEDDNVQDKLADIHIRAAGIAALLGELGGVIKAVSENLPKALPGFLLSTRPEK